MINLEFIEAYGFFCCVSEAENKYDYDSLQFTRTVSQKVYRTRLQTTLHHSYCHQGQVCA